MTHVSGSNFHVLGTNVHLGRQLNSDRDANYFALADDDSRAAKIYKQRASAREPKLRAMVDNVPRDSALYSPHSAVCWPQALIYNVERELCGFIAPRFESASSWPLLHYCDPASRRRISARTTWRSLVQIAINLCAVMEAVHSQGHVIGDINKTNLFVSENLRVSLVDCESVSVKDNSTGRRYATALGTKALTPPELQGMSGEIQRDPADDQFMLAVAIFLLLMEGAHPFDGTWHGDGAPPTLEENIKECRYAYSRFGFLTPAAGGPPFEMMHPVLGKLFERCFINRHPSHRPTAGDWRYELERVERQLKTCGLNPEHIYSGHLSQCPWCGFLKERTSTMTPSARRQAPKQRPAVESPSRFPFLWRRSTR